MKSDVSNQTIAVVISERLKAIENADFVNQIKLVTEFMDYLVDHKDFVRKHHHFSFVLKFKFYEFAVKNNLRLDKQYRDIFDEDLPSRTMLDSLIRLQNQ